MPVITTRHAVRVVQALLHHCPLALVADDEAVQVDLKAVGDRVVVNAGGESAGADECFAVEAVVFCECAQLVGRVARETTTTAADVKSELMRAWRKPTL